LKQYGPVVGALLAFIIWQSIWINKLLDRHEKAYTGEIERMSKHMDRLLNHILGPQPSSEDAPKVKELVKGGKELPPPATDGSTQQ